MDSIDASKPLAHGTNHGTQINASKLLTHGLNHGTQVQREPMGVERARERESERTRRTNRLVTLRTGHLKGDAVLHMVVHLEGGVTHV
jgi:hypothetical protein